MHMWLRLCYSLAAGNICKQAARVADLTFRNCTYKLSRYSAPLGRPDEPDVYMRLTSGSATQPSLPGMTMHDALGSLPARSSSMLVSWQPAGRFARISATAPDALTSSAKLRSTAGTQQA